MTSVNEKLTKAHKYLRMAKKTSDDALKQLDEHLFDNQLELDGTAKGERLDEKLDAIFSLIEEIDTVIESAKIARKGRL